LGAKYLHFPPRSNHLNLHTAEQIVPLLGKEKDQEAEKIYFFAKKIWSIQKKVVPLHPQTFPMVIRSPLSNLAEGF